MDDDQFSSMSDAESSAASVMSADAAYHHRTSINSVLISTGATGTASATSSGAAAAAALASHNKQLIQRVLLSTTANVNLVHEILRSAYFMHLDDCTIVQRVLNAYKKWFLKEAPMPSFMLEPPAPHSSLIVSLNNNNTNMQECVFCLIIFLIINSASTTTA